MNLNKSKPVKNLAGQIFGSLTVLAYSQGKWLCRCSCKLGTYISIGTDKLNSGNTKSCGCLRIKVASARCQEMSKNNRQFPPELSAGRYVWQTYLNNDPQTTLSFNEFVNLTQQNCVYCGVEPRQTFTRWNHKKKKGTFTFNGLDRADNSLPHTKENCVACCWNCNEAKSAQSVENFLLWAVKLKVSKFEPLTEVNLIELPRVKYIYRSIYRGYYNDGDISFEQFYSLSQFSCFYCGEVNVNCQAKEFRYNGLDRIDNDRGHLLNNVVPCCGPCNWAKSTRSLEEFQEWILRITTFQKNKKETERLISVSLKPEFNLI